MRCRCILYCTSKYVNTFGWLPTACSNSSLRTCANISNRFHSPVSSIIFSQIWACNFWRLSRHFFHNQERPIAWMEAYPVQWLSFSMVRVIRAVQEHSRFRTLDYWCKAYALKNSEVRQKPHFLSSHIVVTWAKVRSTSHSCERSFG